MNLRNLEKVLAREEEVKKRAIVHKKVYNGPQIRYLSKSGKLSLFLPQHLKHLIVVFWLDVLFVSCSNIYSIFCFRPFISNFHEWIIF